MFLQNYIHQAATAVVLAHKQPEKLQIPGERSTDINWDAIHYGNLELRARCRRYLRFAMPCMAHDLWVRGLKKDRPTYQMIEKKTSPLGIALNKLCYRNRDVLEDMSQDVVQEIYLTEDLTAEQAEALRTQSKVPSLSLASTHNIPFFDDGHGYSFFKDNTPYDASCNMLLEAVHQLAEENKTRAVALPDVSQIFGHDDYFVIDRFSQFPNDCLGPTADSSIIKKIQLMVGPEFVRDVATASIRDLREMDLWKPTEFDQLMYLSGSSVGSLIKNTFRGITAPMALYWSWVEKVTSTDVPLTTTGWIHKELSDRISAGEVYTIALDQVTLQWLKENKIAKQSKESVSDFFLFPNYDRNKYASRPVAERRMSLDEWAWSPEHAIKLPRSYGVKVTGLSHSTYLASADVTAESQPTPEQNRTRVVQQRSTLPEGLAAYSRTRDLSGRAKQVMSAKAQEFLHWAKETVASADILISTLDKHAPPGESVARRVPGYTPSSQEQEVQDRPAADEESGEVQHMDLFNR